MQSVSSLLPDPSVACVSYVHAVVPASSLALVSAASHAVASVVRSEPVTSAHRSLSAGTDVTAVSVQVGGASTPFSLCLPSAHSRQPDSHLCPVPSTYLPTSHTRQSAGSNEPSSSLYVPAMQSAQSVSSSLSTAALLCKKMVN